MTPEDISATRRHYEEVVSRWEVVKSSTKEDIDLYRNDVADAMVAVNSYIEWCEKKASQAKDDLSEAKKMRRNLTERENQAKRTYWILRDHQPHG